MQDLKEPTPLELTAHSTPVMNPRLHSATTKEHKILASKFHYFVFETEAPFAYIPGQYINVKVSNQRINDYSIAGSNGNTLDFVVDVSPGGPGSAFFENLKTGDRITYLGPSGIFTLQLNDGSTHLLFLATGAGISPLKCIIDSALKDRQCILPITLYFGLRYNADIFWQDYFQDLVQQYPHFTFKLILSKPDEGWQGLKGHITDYVAQDFPDLKDFSTYLCGNQNMINEATNSILSKGCPKERIYTEKF